MLKVSVVSAMHCSFALLFYWKMTAFTELHAYFHVTFNYMGDAVFPRILQTQQRAILGFVRLIKIARSSKSKVVCLYTARFIPCLIQKAGRLVSHTGGNIHINYSR